MCVCYRILTCDECCSNTGLREMGEQILVKNGMCPVRFGSGLIVPYSVIVWIATTTTTESKKELDKNKRKKFLNKTKHTKKNKTWRFFFKGDCERFSSSSTKRNHFNRIYILYVQYTWLLHNFILHSYYYRRAECAISFQFFIYIFFSYLFLPNLGNLCSVPPPGLIRTTLVQAIVGRLTATPFDWTIVLFLSRHERWSLVVVGGFGLLTTPKRPH